MDFANKIISLLDSFLVGLVLQVFAIGLQRFVIVLFVARILGLKAALADRIHCRDFCGRNPTRKAKSAT